MLSHHEDMRTYGQELVQAAQQMLSSGMRTDVDVPNPKTYSWPADWDGYFDRVHGLFLYLYMQLRAYQEWQEDRVDVVETLREVEAVLAHAGVKLDTAQ